MADPRRATPFRQAAARTRTIAARIARIDRRSWSIAAALVALTVAVYTPVWRHAFVAYDDPRYVYENAHVLGGLTTTNMWWAFTNMQGPYWHPLTWLSHMLDAGLFGLRAGGHHTVNLMWHLANTAVLFFLLARMTGSTWRSATVAALFAVHPLHVESVAWIAERKDVLSTAFMLLTTWVYVDWVRRRSAWRYVLMSALYACGLMAKPMLVTLPFVLLLLDVWPLARTDVTWRRRIVEKLPLAAMAAAMSVVTMFVESRVGVVSGLGRLPLALRLANVLRSYVVYLGHAIWPAGLSAFYPYPPTMPSAWIIGAMLLFLGGISAVVTIAGRRHPYAPVGWCWYLLTLVPVIGFVQAGDQAMGDRFTYVPLLGIFIAAVWGAADLIARLPSRRIAQPVVAGLAIASAAIAAHVQVGYWANGITLWAHAIDVDPANHRAHGSLAQALTIAKRGPEAAAQYAEAIRIAPDVAEYHHQLAVLLAREGQLPAARAEFTEALRLHPNDPRIQTSLGQALSEAGRLDEAILHFSEVIRVMPEMAEGHTNLGAAFAHRGEVAEATAEFSEALRLDPGEAQAHSDFGVLLLSTGQREQALGELEEAVRLEPASAYRHEHLAGALASTGRVVDAQAEYEKALLIDPATVEAHNGLGVILSAAGRSAEAVAQFAEAVRLAPGTVSLRKNLGRTLAEQGDIEAAVFQFQEILRLVPDDEDARRAVSALRRPNGPR